MQNSSEILDHLMKNVITILVKITVEPTYITFLELVNCFLILLLLYITNALL